MAAAAVRWALKVVDNLERIFRYVETSNPAAPLGVIESIDEAGSSLQTFPERGRSRRPGARELVCTPCPYILVYRIDRQTVEIARV